MASNSPNESPWVVMPPPPGASHRATYPPVAAHGSTSKRISAPFFTSRSYAGQKLRSTNEVLIQCPDIASIGGGNCNKKNGGAHP
jgi:hypothetical protein